MNRNLILMVGVAGSGKSTWLKNNAKGLVVSRDEIRFGMVDESEDYFAREDAVYKAYTDKIEFCLTHEVPYKNIYVDATHLTGKSRNRLLSNLSLKDVDVSIVFMNTPLEKCIENDSKREGRKCVGEQVIRNQYSQLVKPTHNEKFKYKYIMEVT